MRTAIISDIHANVIALEACLYLIGTLNVSRIFCLGDVVGYNPWPNECIEIIRKRGIPCVMGNHDRVAACLIEPDVFAPAAKEAIFWTRRVLTDYNREFLMDLPDHLAIYETALLVHGSPRDPDEYILNIDTARENIGYMEKNVREHLAFFGHTHVSCLYHKDQDISAAFHPKKTVLSSAYRSLANPGSVGQPRDNDPRAGFLIYDGEDMSIEFFRVKYDVDAVYRAIVDAGLPEELGKRLFSGR